MEVSTVIDSNNLNIKVMKTIHTQHKSTRRIKKQNLLTYVMVILSILLFSLTIQTAFGDNGKLKVKGDIINVQDEDAKSLVTLFRVPEDGAGTFVLGQFIVEGNDWFKTHMELDKKYMVEIASTNGVTKRFFFDTHVPEDVEGSRMKVDLAFDMGPSNEARGVLNAGEVSFEDKEIEFAFIDWIDNNSVAMSPTK